MVKKYDGFFHWDWSKCNRPHECKHKGNHKCSCKSKPYKCRHVGNHPCVCRVMDEWGNEKFKARICQATGDHPCTCVDIPSYCRFEGYHQCSCDKGYRYHLKCKATKSHVCICAKGIDQDACRAHSLGNIVDAPPAYSVCSSSSGSSSSG